MSRNKERLETDKLTGGRIMSGFRTSATDAQLHYIRYLMDQEGYDEDDLYNIYGREIQSLTKEEASGMIGWLKGEAKPAHNPLVKRALIRDSGSPKRVYLLNRDKTFKKEKKIEGD